MNYIKKLLALQEKLTPAPDKLAHFYWGFWIALFGVILYGLFGWIWWIVLPSIVLAALKEIRDAFGFGNPEFWDFIITVVPSIVLFFLTLILQ